MIKSSFPCVFHWRFAIICHSISLWFEIFTSKVRNELMSIMMAHSKLRCTELLITYLGQFVKPVNEKSDKNVFIIFTTKFPNVLKYYWNTINVSFILQTYISKYKFRNAKMSELWKTFEEVSDYAIIPHFSHCYSFQYYYFNIMLLP